MMLGKHAVVVIPTYNAKNSILELIFKTLKSAPGAKIIVVDDNSPDKTAQVIRENFSSDKRVDLIMRKGKGGRGSAVIRGFEEGLKDKSTEFFIEMDADLCHDPKDIPNLIKECLKSDVVIASRYARGSINLKWKLKRKLFSKAVSYFIKFLLKVPINDYTNGFRCYKRKVIESINLKEIRSKGFIVLTELAFKLHKKGFSFGEIPSRFQLYDSHSSNLNLKELKEAFFTILRLKMEYLLILPQASVREK